MIYIFIGINFPQAPGKGNNENEAGYCFAEIIFILVCLAAENEEPAVICFVVELKNISLLISVTRFSKCYSVA